MPAISKGPILQALTLLLTLTPPAFAAQAPGTGGGKAIPVITGSVFYRERIALPPDAALEVTVEDVSRADAPAPIIGQLRVMPTGQVPISFETPYDPNRVEPGHRYAVRARILVGDRLLYTTTQQFPVLTQGAGTHLDRMLLQRVAVPGKTDAKPDRELTNTYWKLTALRGQPVKSGERQREAHIILQTENHRIAGSGGCNRLMGGYKLAGNTVEFSKIASTQMACMEGMEQESAFFQVLQGTRTWKIHGDTLELLDESGAKVADFSAVDLR